MGPALAMGISIESTTSALAGAVKD